MYKFVEFELGLDDAWPSRSAKRSHARAVPADVPKPTIVPEPPPVEIEKPAEDSGGFDMWDELI